ncbi:MAG: hypothetical protein KBI46_11440 [Phycisphaerae bacterium]|nr:hypothetical protein [Phycisphaerae bacterium]
MNYPENEPAYADNFLHLFDDGGTGLYTLYYEPLNLPPAVSRITAANLTAVSCQPLPLTVTYQTQTGIDESTLDDGDIAVIGQQGQPLTVHFRQVLLRQGQTIEVLYHILPPNGLWEAGANGLYAVSLGAGQVAGRFGIFAEPALLGGFAVSIPACVNLEVSRSQLRSQRRISSSIFEFTYAAIVKNHCSLPVRNLHVIPLSVPANLELVAHDLRFCYIPANGEAVSSGTFTVRMDYTNPPDPQEPFGWQWVLFDSADVTMDGTVDLADLAAFAAAWLTDNSCYDWLPQTQVDGRVDLNDFGILSEHWKTANP